MMTSLGFDHCEVMNLYMHGYFIALDFDAAHHQGALLPAWFNLYPSMDM